MTIVGGSCWWQLLGGKRRAGGGGGGGRDTTLKTKNHLSMRGKITLSAAETYSHYLTLIPVIPLLDNCSGALHTTGQVSSSLEMHSQTTVVHAPTKIARMVHGQHQTVVHTTGMHQDGTRRYR